MAIWSKFNRISSTLSQGVCETCSGNGEKVRFDEHNDEFVCGGPICPDCKGTGFNKPNAEVLKLITAALEE